MGGPSGSEIYTMLRMGQMPSDGALFYNTSAAGFMLAWGTTKPADGSAGYAPGCIFIHTDGSGYTTFYVNTGTAESCEFSSYEIGLQDDLAAVTNGKGASMIGLEDSADKVIATNVEDGIAEIAAWKETTDAWKTAVTPQTPVQIADPGTGGEIPVTASGNCSITIGSDGAETSTLANPTFVGQRLSISVAEAGTGTRKVTVASAINKAGNVSITLAAAGDSIELVAMKVGTELAWRVVVNDGCTLGA